MIFFKENKIENLYCPECGGNFYHIYNYPEYYPEYEYGCPKCQTVFAKRAALTQIPEKLGEYFSNSES